MQFSLNCMKIYKTASKTRSQCFYTIESSLCKLCFGNKKIFKKRLLCRDFKGRKGRDQLLLDSGSTFVIRDAKLLHTFCSTLTPEPIIERLLSQCHFIARRGNRLFFHDYSTKKISRNSFINRSKYISELIPFEWTNLNCPAFNAKIKSITPPSLRLT
jgi:hypothetical protein